MKKLTLIITISLGMFSQVFAGGITGKIVFDGKAPTMKKLKLEADPICVANNEGNTPTKEWLIVDENGGVKNIIVSIKEGVSGTQSVPTESVVLDQQGCVYRPHVIAIMAGQNVEILNSDGIMHNIHALPKLNREFNKAMPKFKKKITTQFEKAEKPFKIKCDVHPWMSAYIGVFDHPFFAVTGDDGTYTISGLETGEYVIEAWHEKLGTQLATVTVVDGNTTADFTFNKPSKK